jgi:hypothetical protein
VADVKRNSGLGRAKRAVLRKVNHLTPELNQQKPNGEPVLMWFVAAIARHAEAVTGICDIKGNWT